MTPAPPEEPTPSPTKGHQMSDRAKAARQAANLALMMIRNLEADEDDGGELRGHIDQIPNGLIALCLGYEILISALLKVVTDGNAERRPATINALAELVRKDMSTTAFETAMTFEEIIRGLELFDDGKDE